MERKILLSTVLLLLIVPFAHAYSIDRIWLEWNGHHVQTIAPGKELPNTMLRFELSNDFSLCFNTSGPCQIRIESSQLPPIEGLVDIRTECAINDGIISCERGPFRFSTLNATIDIGYFGDVPDGRVPAQRAGFSLLLDTTRPNVTGITTGYCDDETCYAGSGVPTPIEVRFTDSVTSFEYNLVFLGGSTSSLAQVDECAGTSCTGTIVLPCTDGQRFTVRVSDPSTEDALNAPQGSGREVTCAAKAPRLHDWQQESDGIAGLAVKGGTARFAAEIESFTGDPSGEVNVSGVLNATGEDILDAQCSPAESEGRMLCTWEFQDLVPGTHNLRFIIADAVNNYVTKDVRLEVLDLGTGEPGDFFTINVLETRPDSLNRMALDLAASNHLPYPMYVTYEVVPRDGGVHILTQELTRCWYALEGNETYTQEYRIFSLGDLAGGRPESHVLYPTLDHGQQNRLDLQVRADRNILALTDSFNARCEISLYARKGTTVYDAPERENVSFTVRFRESPLGQPGERFTKKITDHEERLSSGTWETIRTLEEFRQKADQVCRGMEGIQYATSVFSTIRGIGAAFCSSGWGYGIGEVLKDVSLGPLSSLHGIVLQAWNGYSGSGGATDMAYSRARFYASQASKKTFPQLSVMEGGWLRNICRQVNCRITADMQTLGGSYEQRFGDDVEAIADKAAPPPANANEDGYYTDPDTGETRQSVNGFLKDELLSDAFVFDPQRSITGAAFSMCAGGVIYNLQKYAAIDCAYVQCLKDQSLKGHNQDVCERRKDYQTCVEVVGIMGELPWTYWAENILGNINDFLQNLPMMALRFEIDNTCLNYKGPLGTASDASCIDWPRVGCLTWDSITGVFDAQKQSAQASAGIRDTRGAEEAVRVCESVLSGDDASQQAVGSFLQSTARAVLRYQGFIAQAQGLSVENEHHENQLKADATYRSIAGDEGSVPPETYEGSGSVQDKSGKITGKWRTEDGKVVFYRKNKKGEYEEDKDGKQKPFRQYESPYPSWADTGDERAAYTRMLRSGIVPATEEQFVQWNTELENYEQAIHAMESITDSDIQVEIDRLDAEIAACESNDECSERELDEIKEQKEEMESAKERKKQGLNAIEYQQYIQNQIDSADQTIAELEEDLEMFTACATQAVCPDALTPAVASSALSDVQDDLDDAREKKQSLEAQKDTLAREQVAARTEALGRAFGLVSSFVVKEYYDEITEWSTTSGLAEQMGLESVSNIFKELDSWLDEDKRAQSICSDQYEVYDNDDGAVYAIGEGNAISIAATFGSEIRLFNETPGEEGTGQYIYITIAHMTNPQGSGKDFTVEVYFEGLDDCRAASCPERVSLTGNRYNLTEGTSFGRGQGAASRVDYLPGRYERICIQFDKSFPDERGREKYCRTIREDTIQTGSPAPQQTQSPGSGQGGGTDPLEGWS